MVFFVSLLNFAECHLRPMLSMGTRLGRLCKMSHSVTASLMFALIICLGNNKPPLEPIQASRCVILSCLISFSRHRTKIAIHNRGQKKKLGSKGNLHPFGAFGREATTKGSATMESYNSKQL